MIHMTEICTSQSHKKIFERLQKALHTWLDRWDDSDPIATENAFIQK